jgi:hypothetical protein
MRSDAGSRAPASATMAAPTLAPAPGPPASFDKGSLDPNLMVPFKCAGDDSVTPAQSTTVNPTLAPAPGPPASFGMGSLIAEHLEIEAPDTDTVGVQRNLESAFHGPSPNYKVVMLNRRSDVQSTHNGDNPSSTIWNDMNGLDQTHDAIDLQPFVCLGAPSKAAESFEFLRGGTPGPESIATNVSAHPLYHASTTYQLPHATIQGVMDTFVVPRASNDPALRVADTPFRPTMWHIHNPPRIVQDKFDGQITYSFSPGMQPIELSMDGLVDGSEFQSSLDPSHLLDSNALHYNNLRIVKNGEGIEIGGGGDAVPDTGVGVRLFKPVNGASGEAGFGLYQRLGATGFSLIPGIDTELRESSTHSLNIALAADSPIRLTQDSRLFGWTAQNFVGWNALDKQTESSISMSRNFASTSVTQSLSIDRGKSNGISWGQSFFHRFGDMDVSLGSSIVQFTGNSQKEALVGLIRPIGRNLFSAHLISGTSTNNGLTLSENVLNTSLILPPHKGSMVIFNDNMSSSGYGTGQHQTSVSDNWTIGRAYDFRLGLNHDWRTNRAILNGTIGIKVTSDWEAKIMLGAATDPSTGIMRSTLFGFQLINRFDLITYGSGTVRGSVLIGGQPANEPIQMQMDDRFVTTDDHGNFQFNRAMIGPHEIGFDMSSLPANLNPLVQTQDIQVIQGKTTSVMLTAERIGIVRGIIHVCPDAFGKIDPSASAGIIVTDGQGHDTTSNPDGTYVLGALPLGHHTLSVLTSSLPPGYIVTGKQTQEVDVVDVQTAPAIDFSIAPNQQIDMTVLSK